jgi:hypothetical protein
MPKNGEAFGTLIKIYTMKNFFLKAFLFFSFSALAQSISVKEGKEKFSTGTQNSFIATIFGNDMQEVMTEWKKVMKDFKHEKVKENKNEVFGDNILIKEWGNNPVDIYAAFDESKKDKTIRMAVAVDLGGAYLENQDKEKSRYMEKLVKEFALKMTKAPIEESIKQNQKMLSKMEDQQRDLEKEKKHLENDIISYKGKISKAEKETGIKEVEIEKKKEEIKTQQKVLDASADAVNEQAKNSRKIYDKLNNQLKDLEKDHKNLKEDIVSYHKKIEKADAEIKTNEQNQEKKKQEIENQKKVVDDLKKKLDGVR